jgi:hypothetical protein
MLEKVFNQHPTFYKWDKLYVGFICGIVGPVFGIAIFFATQYATISPENYMRYLTNRNVMSPLFSFGCIANLVIFFLFIQRDYINAARGVILATFIWAIPIIYFKFF